MNARHTPGPWSSRGRGIFAGQFCVCGPPHENTDLDICGRIANRISNARLIAAAPELLESLKDCIGPLSHLGEVSTLAKVEAAIAKAEGRT